MLSISSIADSAAQRHGQGSVLTVFEALPRSHAVHIEVTQHGCFAKMHYAMSDDKYNLSPNSPTTESSHCAAPRNRCLSPQSVLSGCSSQGSSTLASEDILNMRHNIAPSCPRGHSKLQSVKVFDISHGEKDEVENDKYALSLSEPLKLVTAEHYIKMPLG